MKEGTTYKILLDDHKRLQAAYNTVVRAADDEVAHLTEQLEKAGGILYDICEATNTEWLDDAEFPTAEIKRKFQAAESEAACLRTEARKWRDEYNELCKFTNDYEAQAARLRAERDALQSLSWALVQSLYHDGEGGTRVSDDTAAIIDNLEARLNALESEKGNANDGGFSAKADLVEELETERDAAMAAVLAVPEWVTLESKRPFGSQYHGCIWCRNDCNEGHADGCQRQAICGSLSRDIRSSQASSRR